MSYNYYLKCIKAGRNCNRKTHVLHAKLQFIQENITLAEYGKILDATLIRKEITSNQQKDFHFRVFVSLRRKSANFGAVTQPHPLVLERNTGNNANLN
jgi:glucuronate isomerase